jgi:protein translocase SecG subunit
MALLEKIWGLIGIAIIFIILSTDPKSSISGASNQQLAGLFASASDGQKFVQKLNWLFIFLFFIFTVALSYYG